MNLFDRPPPQPRAPAAPERPEKLPITDSRCIAVGEGGHVTNCQCRENVRRFQALVAAVEADGPLEATVLAQGEDRICNACYPHPSHVAGSCEYCNCGSVALRGHAPVLPKATVGLRRVSHSELVSFLTCTRLHHYAYRLRREPRVTAEPLLVGRRIETIIKQLWLGETPDLSELPPEERALCKTYPIWWRHHSLHVKRTDISFQVEIAGILYVGEFDGDGEDKGEDIIVELKTTSEDISPGAPYWRRVAQVDPQVTTYLMAARAQGRKLRRVVYDVIRKVTLERAKATPLEKRKYTKVTKAEPIARLYANMRETDETDDEYELRVLEDIAEKPDRYFQRHDIVRYEDEHQAHLRDVAGNVRLMQLVETMPEAPRNVNSCFKWGRSCPYLPVCLGEDRIDNNLMYQDRKREKRMWGVLGRPDPATVPPLPISTGLSGKYWLGIPRATFPSYEEAVRVAKGLPGVWEALELPK